MPVPLTQLRVGADPTRTYALCMSRMYADLKHLAQKAAAAVLHAGRVSYGSDLDAFSVLLDTKAKLHWLEHGPFQVVMAVLSSQQPQKPPIPGNPLLVQSPVLMHAHVSLLALKCL